MDRRDELDWKMVREHPAEDYRVFRVHRREALHPRTGAVHTFSIIRSSDWVNVVALTPDDQVVLVRQYRHGTGRQSLEIPGGMVDPGESPLEAAQRELREETGYATARWIDLGMVEPNPAIQTNRCHTWLALDAERVGELELDPGEVLVVETTPLSAVADLVRSGAITHALVVAAFYHFLVHAGGWRRPA
ncbi:MAG TPA: NUDIX hydrolase [Haliangium sp.]|nr:NUDIX hydrolase [Haliangium sp.]